MQENKNFEMDGDVLVKYHGTDEKVVIPEDIRVIGEAAFYETFPRKQIIKEVIIPSSVEVIRGCAFYKCEELTDVHFMKDSHLISIMAGAFSECRNLKEIHFPDSLAYIGNCAFISCDLQSVHIPKATSYIAYDAFGFNYELKEFTVDPKNECYMAYEGVLYQKEERMVVKCPLAKTGIVHIPEGMVKIESRAFAWCENIEEIILPDSIYSIESEVFRFCTKLKKLDVPYLDSFELDTFEDIGDCEIILHMRDYDIDTLNLASRLKKEGFNIRWEFV